MCIEKYINLFIYITINYLLIFLTLNDIYLHKMYIILRNFSK